MQFNELADYRYSYLTGFDAHLPALAWGTMGVAAAVYLLRSAVQRTLWNGGVLLLFGLVTLGQTNLWLDDREVMAGMLLGAALLLAPFLSGRTDSALTSFPNLSEDGEVDRSRWLTWAVVVMLVCGAVTFKTTRWDDWMHIDYHDGRHGLEAVQYMKMNRPVDLKEMVHQNYRYFTVWSMDWAGYSPFGVRLPSVLGQIIVTALVWDMGRMMFSPAVGILGALFWIINPYSFFLTKFAPYDGLVPVFGAFAIWGTVRMAWRESYWAAPFVWAALLFGRGLHPSYYAIYLIVPVVGFIGLFQVKRRKWLYCLAWAVIGGSIIALNYKYHIEFFKMSGDDRFLLNRKGVSFFWQWMKDSWRAVSQTIYRIQAGICLILWNSRPALTFPEIVFFLTGVGVLLRRIKTPAAQFMLAWVGVMFLFLGLSEGEIRRGYILWGGTSIIAAVGLACVLEALTSWLPGCLTLGRISVLAASAVLFFHNWCQMTAYYDTRYAPNEQEETAICYHARQEAATKEIVFFMQGVHSHWNFFLYKYTKDLEFFVLGNNESRRLTKDLQFLSQTIWRRKMPLPELSIYVDKAPDWVPIRDAVQDVYGPPQRAESYLHVDIWDYIKPKGAHFKEAFEPPQSFPPEVHHSQPDFGVLTLPPPAQKVQREAMILLTHSGNYTFSGTLKGVQATLTIGSQVVQVTEAAPKQTFTLIAGLYPIILSSTGPATVTLQDLTGKDLFAEDGRVLLRKAVKCELFKPNFVGFPLS